MAKHETLTGLTQDRRLFFPPASPVHADYYLAICCTVPLFVSCYQMSQMIDNLHGWMDAGEDQCIFAFLLATLVALHPTPVSK